MICRYRGCPSTRVKNPTLSFFYFPKDQVQRDAWLTRSGNEMLCGLSSEELKSRAFRLCGLHFKDSEFKNDSKKGLNWNALPTEYDPVAQTVEGLPEVRGDGSSDRDDEFNYEDYSTAGE